MKKILVVLMCACALCATTGLQAYCARCAQIEGERAQQQVENPQPAGYYDENIQNLSE